MHLNEPLRHSEEFEKVNRKLADKLAEMTDSHKIEIKRNVRNTLNCFAEMMIVGVKRYGVDSTNKQKIDVIASALSAVVLRNMEKSFFDTMIVIMNLIENEQYLKEFFGNVEDYKKDVLDHCLSAMRLMSKTPPTANDIRIKPL